MPIFININKITLVIFFFLNIKIIRGSFRKHNQTLRDAFKFKLILQSLRKFFSLNQLPPSGGVVKCASLYESICVCASLLIEQVLCIWVQSEGMSSQTPMSGCVSQRHLWPNAAQESRSGPSSLSCFHIRSSCMVLMVICS